MLGYLELVERTSKLRTVPLTQKSRTEKYLYFVDLTDVMNDKMNFFKGLFILTSVFVRPLFASN